MPVQKKHSKKRKSKSSRHSTNKKPKTPPFQPTHFIPELLSIYDCVIFTYGTGGNDLDSETGCGVTIYLNGQVSCSWYGSYSESGSINQSELKAIAFALRYINENKDKSDYFAIVSKSHYAINSIWNWSEKWASNNWCDRKKKPIANQGLIKECFELFSTVKDATDPLYISGNSSYAGNKISRDSAFLAIEDTEEAWSLNRLI